MHTSAAAQTADPHAHPHRPKTCDRHTLAALAQPQNVRVATPCRTPTPDWPSRHHRDTRGGHPRARNGVQHLGTPLQNEARGLLAARTFVAFCASFCCSATLARAHASAASSGVAKCPSDRCLPPRHTVDS
eukprot:7114119-Prymnesium_polylepis.2